MASHPAFSMPDILYAILDKFAAPEEDITLERERKATLVAAATCCKIISSPALDILWSDMSSVVPLFQIIPSFGIPQGSETKYVCPFSHQTQATRTTLT